MQTDEQKGSTGQTDPAGGTESTPQAGSQKPPDSDNKGGAGNGGDTVAISKTDLDELNRLAADGQNYKEAVQRLENELSEEKTRVEELSRQTASSPIFGQLPENMTEEEAKGIERDFKRQSKDLLARKTDLSELTPKQCKEFDKEYRLRSSLVYQESLKAGEFTPVSELESVFDTALRFVKGVTNEEELRKARLAGQTEMLNREAGDAGSTAQSTTETKVEEISAEALAEADRSLLVERGLMTKEEMAKRIQKRINEGR